MLKANDHVLEYVDDYLHDVLEQADAAYVEQHCERCRICKVALDEAQKRQSALATVPPSEASGLLIQDTLAKIDSYEWRRRRDRKILSWGLVTAVAASVAILCGFHLHYVNLTATPYNLWVLGQSDLLVGSIGSLRVRLTDEKTGAPLAGVPVDIEVGIQLTNLTVPLAQFTTDADGTGQPRFQLPETWPDGTYKLRVIAHTPGSPEILIQEIRIKRSWKVMLTSDKPIYQPGQTIHIRSLALRKPDLKPLEYGPTFSITDPKGNVIFRDRKSSSPFGIAATDCPLASEILEGPYMIACKVGDTESKLTVEVKKYVLPKFKIDVKLDRPYYQPGDKVTGKLHAQYFFGKPVINGEVQIEVRTTDVEANAYRKLAARTNASGDAVFEFELPDSLVGKEQASGDAHVQILVTLRDTAGQQQSKSVSSIVTSNPLRIEIIPEGGSLVRDVPNMIYLYASYADGRPARAQLNVSGLPEDLATNDLGVASFQITPQSEQVSLTIRGTDAQGLIGRRHVQLNSGQASPDFLLRPDKAVCNGGDSLHLLALGGGSEPVFVDLIKDDQTILIETIDLTKGRGECVVDLPPELFGTVRLTAYRFGSAGLAVRKTRTLYVRPAGQLAINATMDRAQYRPGKQAKLQLALTDQQGKAVPGALSLAAVDEAVYAVLDQAPGMERTFYLLEQQLLQPVFAIYPWSPDLTNSKPAEREQFEQALFARTTASESYSGKQTGDTSLQTHGPHSLTASSFPIKVDQVERTREQGFERMRHLWAIFLVLSLLLGYVAVWVFVRPLSLVAVLHVLLVFGICVVSIPFLDLGCGSHAPQASMKEASMKEARARSAPRLDDLKFNIRMGIADESHKSIKRKLHSETGRSAEPSEVQGVPVRVREWFPETLLWRPEVITDDNGHASLDVDLADSITTWRLLASAVAADGRLGGTQTPIVVFQPFFVDLNLPVALTRGDEVAIPVVVYNYLDKAQTVELTLGNAPWFERLDDAVKHIDLAAGEVRSTSYRLRVTKVGNHELQVTARGSGVADALKKQVEVVPDGQRLEQVYNGTLQHPARIALTVPEEAIEGSAKAILKIYPSTFSQLVEGLDAIFQRPYGCFEQTSSTTYPNILALDYLRRTNKRVPEVEAKARQYIHLGYQRLLGFEVSGGGFDWFGHPPANRTLTAYGLMEFVDMAKVHDVDPRLIERTRDWLLAQRNADGSWSPESHQMHDDPAQRAHDETARFSTTAYIAWAVFNHEGGDRTGQPGLGRLLSQQPVTLDYLLSHRPDTLNDPYVLALACNALLALEPTDREARPYLNRLNALKSTSPDGKRVWWEQSPGTRTAFYGSGRSGSIETTALAALAMIKSANNPETARAALSWLIEQKDAAGTWGSTQATVLALKALIAGTGKSLGGDQERRILIQWSNGQVPLLVIPADQAEVMQQIDLSKKLGPGTHRLTVTEHSDTAAGYQVTLRYHVPGVKAPDRREPLAISLVYDRTELAVQDTVTATATVVNQMQETAPMVLLDLPIPPGFALEAEDLSKLVTAGSIAKYQVNPRTAVVYLRGLEPGESLQLRYRLRATMPVKVTAPSARVYEYYDPDKQAVSQTARLIVRH
jgi:hypothetical protein